MSVSVADIDCWDAGDVREVFHATRNRAEAAFEAADGITELPAFGSWGGDASDAARDAIGRTRRDLDAHGNEALAVAQAARKAADDIELVTSKLAQLRFDADHMGMTVDPVRNAIGAGPGSAGDPPIEIELKRMQLQSELDAVLAEAVRVDQELASTIDMATGVAPVPDTPHDNRREIQDALSRRLPEDALQFNHLWEQLTPEEKEWLYQHDHVIGNHPGMPFGDKDGFNRRHLVDLTTSAQAEVDRLAGEHPDWAAAGGQFPYSVMPQRYGQYGDWKRQWDAANTKLDGFHTVAQTLAKDDGYHRYLGLVDDNGHAAISIGDPDKSIRTATLVPGTGQDLSTIDGADGKSADMLRAALDADPSLKADNVAVTTWMGYDRPMNIPEAGSASYAEHGAGALDSFLTGVQASQEGSIPSTDTLIGHSYGSTLVGAAGAGDHHLAVENVIAVGSPGMLVGHAADFSLDPGGQVYATRAEHDIIQLVAGAVLGPNPTWNGFGAIELEAAPGPATGPDILDIPSIGAHSSYWDEGNPALANMGAIIAGLPPPKVVP